MAGFDNDVVYGTGLDLSGNATVANRLATDGYLYIGNSAGNPVAALPVSSDSSVTWTGGNGSLDSVVNKSKVYIQPGVYNLAVTYSAGTLTIKGANGSDLSSSNPGYLVIQSNVSARQLVVVSLTSNFHFQDAAGTGEVTGNEFGVVNGSVGTNPVPFYLYMALDDNDANPQFFLCRFPNLINLPATTAIGTPSSAIADKNGDFWCFESITVANYDTNHAIAVGGIRMTQTGTFNWTVASLAKSDGIGRFYENLSFIWRPIMRGSSTAGSFTYATHRGIYQFSKNGKIVFDFLVATSASASSPAGFMIAQAPFKVGSLDSTSRYGPFFCDGTTTVPSSTNQITIEAIQNTQDIYFRSVVFGTSATYLSVDSTALYAGQVTYTPDADQS